MKGCHLMKLTDIIGATLKKYQINEVFGLQGGAVVHIFDSIEKYGVKTVYTLHEQSAALASVANAKVTGKFGCAVVTTGPGTTNAITGLLGAWNDSIPCIFISGQVRSDHVSYNKPVRQVGTQEAPICNIVKPITKLSIFIKDPSTFQEELEKAICIACEGRPGPVWIDIPLEYQWLDVPYKSNYIKQPDNKNYDNDKINTFEKFLMESKKPLLVLGYGIRLSDTIDLNVKLLLARFIFPSCVPADFNKISSPAASRVISPTASMIKSSVAVSVSASRVISSTTTPALAVTTPVEIIVPELVKLPTTSINVAVSSISSVAAISRTVALAPCMN